jgi:hypothetical protein
MPFILHPCVISGVCREADENWALVSCYAASSVNILLTFRNRILEYAFSWVKIKVKFTQEQDIMTQRGSTGITILFL